MQFFFLQHNQLLTAGEKMWKVILWLHQAKSMYAMCIWFPRLIFPGTVGKCQNMLGDYTLHSGIDIEIVSSTMTFFSEICNICNSATIQFWNFLIFSFSNSDTSQFWHFPILTNSNSNTFQLWHFPIMTLSNYDTFQLWHFPILTLFNSDTFFHFLHVPIQTLSNSDIFQTWYFPTMTIYNHLLTIFIYGTDFTILKFQTFTRL